ncbi:SAM-dependent methyltransferase domain-containing protein [Desulfonema limicola]|uniref:site-specific DNA-methyltransferase (adenine-specific) n=1 Tax=Desulfonema limicola TaxID=45656 RepID=A0A975GEK2_9BACT|nr:type ISP restriction/modification enzyme [Desulfonema limicola]QTA78209.1 SAM-dependent methyltransferase domain-containing protein [Desulfonema limicola]
MKKAEKMINSYIDQINKRFKTGLSTEHTFRGDLQTFLESFDRSMLVTNEPARIQCGAPDFIITKNNIPLGYIEAKDIGISLAKTDKTEQLKRYKQSLDNLILTDYLDFRLYRNGEFAASAAIGRIKDNKIEALPDAFEDFKNLIADFYTHTGQTVTSPLKLAEMMAGKAKMMQAVIEKAVTSDEENEQDSTLKDQMLAFKHILIHDIKPSEFADIYAQTIAYGMFAARLHDKTLEDFSRQKAAELIPKSNPFLRSLFSYIAGPDIDDRILWIVDALADIFRAADLVSIMSNFGTTTQMTDPVVHFYETFLSKYNPKLRKSRGVWYTPEPVVNFIVRAVDDILKAEFDLPQGLADTSKISIQVQEQGVAKGKARKEVHKVQILDPAAGTGTFLAEVVKQVYKKFQGQQGIWSNYVEDHLIPRLNGFEILMASYAMAHLKLDLLLTETGYKPKKQNRFRIFLTNSLEESHPDTGTLFASWLSKEASEANFVKRDTPVMVVLGNPPYSVSSSNKGEWIKKLIADYKKDLNEKKINLDDDYIKFIRYAQYFIDKNRQGIVAMITNNSFIDGITHRQMRKSLLETFDKIYIIDLHGSTKKNETTPEGEKDENVFDIQQGVSINIFVKKSKMKKNADVFHFEIFGLRREKYIFLNGNSINSINWEKLKSKSPYFFFIPTNFDLIENYNRLCSINDLFLNVNSGIKTDRDNLFIGYTKNEIADKFSILLGDKISDTFKEKYRIIDSGSYKITSKIKGAKYKKSFITPLLYRPFDIRYIYYDTKIVSRPAEKVTKHILKGSITLVSCRQQSTFDFQHIMVSNWLTEVCTVSLQTKETGYAFPLYLYPDENGQQTFDNDTERKPNLNPEIIQKIAKSIKLTFTTEKEQTKDTFAPIDILDYIYAVLHSPAYRETYKEFLKIDFPRVPYPKDRKIFWQLAKLGEKLRTIHLLENPVVEQYITTYPKDGSNIVTRKITKKDYEITDKKKQLGRVWINDEQYFDKVPETAWGFYIGGYQPAQKWLKDRKGRELKFEDILHYQKIITALTQTDITMKQIDKINFM